jgi:hypothetical protein
VEGHERNHEPLGRMRHGLVVGTFHSTAVVSKGAGPPRRDEAAAHGTHWTASS